MSDNKTNIYIVKNIFNSLSPKDLKETIEKSNHQINTAIEKLSRLFSEPREFTTSGYAESTRLVNSITALKDNAWINELFELESNFLNGTNYDTFTNQENCENIINQAIEIKDKFKNDYSDIIKEIQYHDITKQKLEHVIEINNDILKEIQILESINNQEKEVNLKYLEALKEIINIEIAQLIYSSEICNSSIKKIIDAFIEQKKIIDNTESLSKQLKERLISILNLIHSNQDVAKIVETNEGSFKLISQLSTEKANEEFSKLLPSNNEFEDIKKTYTAHINEIEQLSSSKGNFYETIQTINDEITSIRKIISKDIDVSEQEKENNLDFLKKKYTMNSERKIHELALENELLKDFFSEMTEATDDNDVEFF